MVNPSTVVSINQQQQNETTPLVGSSTAPVSTSRGIYSESEEGHWLWHRAKKHRHHYFRSLIVFTLLAVVIFSLLKHYTHHLDIPPAGEDGEDCHSDRNYLVATLLSVFLGPLGIDRFYLGYVFLGLLKLITAGGFGFWWVIDAVLIAVGGLPDVNGCLI